MEIKYVYKTSLFSNSILLTATTCVIINPAYKEVEDSEFYFGMMNFLI